MTAGMDVTFYTRRNCPLCDKAKAAILASRVPVTLHEVDVDEDPELERRFTNDVPVIYADGREAFRHRVTAEEFAEFARNGGRTMSLANEKCVPCHGGVPSLHGDELRALERELGNDWRVVNDHQLEKEWTFPDFAQALAFTNRVGAVAEEEGHHPDIYLAWGRVRITLWTHAVDGLTRSDFVLAAKIDRVR
ncbi:MAG TPA: 4a-hydroxytetrahydrobiopterin dehydratase [Thermoanaerobaculia bacterium]|nr:4a-hydroxytetrahydrobiopterin dehydratase [Thermoanaerobaculia bacterium]